jgi:hypothetical protein
MEKELKITEKAVREAMKNCPTAKEVLTQLFGDQIGDDYKEIIKDFTYSPGKYLQLRDNATVDIDPKLLDAFENSGNPINASYYPHASFPTLIVLLNDIKEKAHKIMGEKW